MKKVVVGIITKIEFGEVRYLLVASKKDFGVHTHFYYPPGGHMEDTENAIDTLVRECYEELQIDIKNPEYLCETASDVPGQQTFWYTASLTNYDFIVDTSELHDAGFFSIEDMRTMNLWPATKSVFQQFYGL